MEPKTLILSLDSNELSGVLELFDQAVRSHGLVVAENAVLLTKKLQAQATDSGQKQLVESLKPKPAKGRGK